MPEPLKKISKDIDKANNKYAKNKDWQAIDTALSTLCGPLPNNQLANVLPKVVAVDRLYKADLIRYLPKPKAGERDTRPCYYVDVARDIAKLDLDARFAELEKQGEQLNLTCLDSVVRIQTTVAEVVLQTTNRNGDVFAAKFLHFCRQDYFPVLDRWAEETVQWIMGKTTDNGAPVIAERFGYDAANQRYDCFCRGILALQGALAQAGLGQYALRELDRYLYGD